MAKKIKQHNLFNDSNLFETNLSRSSTVTCTVSYNQQLISEKSVKISENYNGGTNEGF